MHLAPTPEANDLLEHDSLALLLGMVLDHGMREVWSWRVASWRH